MCSSIPRAMALFFALFQTNTPMVDGFCRWFDFMSVQQNQFDIQKFDILVLNAWNFTTTTELCNEFSKFKCMPMATYRINTIFYRSVLLLLLLILTSSASLHCIRRSSLNDTNEVQLLINFTIFLTTIIKHQFK